MMLKKFLGLLALSAISAPLLVITPTVLSAGQGGLQDLLSYNYKTCLERNYTNSHLAKHPRQAVSYIALRRFPKMWKQPGTLKNANETIMTVHVKFRGSSKKFVESAFCTAKGDKLECGIECDGGGFKLEYRPGGSVLLKTGPHGFRVLASGSCGETDSDDDIKYVSRKTDDKVFLLHRIDDNRCIAPPAKN